MRSVAFAAVCAGVLNSGVLHAETVNITVPNHSFEAPPVPPGVPAYPVHMNWQQTPRRADYVDSPPFTWEVLTGVFPNSAPGSLDHIPNTDGAQAAYLFAERENGVFQELETKFEAGVSYRLKVGITASVNIPPTQGSTLDLVLYYRNAAGAVTPISTSTVTWTLAGPPAKTDFVDYTVFATALQPQGNAAVGKNIGILIKSTATEATKGGVWDIENIRLVATREFIQVPNFSFENPTVPEGAPAYPVINQWQKNPQPGYWNEPTMGAWDQVTGVFPNPAQGQPGHIENTDRAQAAYIFATPGSGLYQELPVKYEPGAVYTLRVGIVGSTAIPPTAETPFTFGFYYRGAQNEMVPLGQKSVPFNTTFIPDATKFWDFNAVQPAGEATSPWIGKNIGISVASGSDFTNAGGVWDADNVRLYLAHPVKLESAREGNGVRILWDSIPGARYQVRVSQDLVNWSDFEGPFVADAATASRLIAATADYAFFTVGSATP